MYSPKINEELIPLIYRAAKEESVPMTHWVNRVLQSALLVAPAVNVQNTENVQAVEKPAA